MKAGYAQSSRRLRLLLDAVRGHWRDPVTSAEAGVSADNLSRSSSSTKSLSLRCFPLHHHDVQPSPVTPSDFHLLLCDKIRTAKRRVTLASLYIGPAADPSYEKEIQLLDALREASSRQVHVTILLDHNRALRPVPCKNGTITSAEACWKALMSSPRRPDASNFRIHLFSVLPDMLQRILPNPYNEVAGVFHIKAYIIDDELILSGANLSEEYFSDRVDRYLHVTQPDLVQCYEDMVDALCQYAHAYSYHNETNHLEAPAISRKQLVNSLKALLTSDSPDAALDTESKDASKSIVAYAVPTFQAPRHFHRGIYARDTLRSDEEALHALIEATAHTHRQDGGVEARIATAYLNPTKLLLSALRCCEHSHFLTAGRVSHGFKPKPKAGNKGKDWIPTVFEYAAQQIRLNNVFVSYYQRPDWTFHSKGLWLTSFTESENVRLPPDATVYAVTHGSGNFGYRSSIRDLESNLVLVFPPGSPVAHDHVREWNQLCEFAVTAREEQKGSSPDGISAWIKLTFPIIRHFF